MAKTDKGNEPGHMDLDASASKEGLSLKAKGAGLFVLLALNILGIIVIGYQLTQKDADMKGYLPLMFLLWIAYELIATLDATLGLRRVHRHD
jgi:hypothetical protein